MACVVAGMPPSFNRTSVVAYVLWDEDRLERYNLYEYSVLQDGCAQDGARARGDIGRTRAYEVYE